MRLRSRTTRPAFSLIEMVLALALGMLLLLALYLTLNTYIINARVGRDVVAEATLARSILNKIANDITVQVGPADPRGIQLAGGASSSSDPNDPSSSANATNAASPSSTTTTDATSTGNGQPFVTFNVGVRGESNWVRLSTYRVQKRVGGQTDAIAEISSDLRRVSYWLSTNGAEMLGLGRGEFKQATNGDIDLDPTQLTDQEQYIFAPEVKSVTFEYFNGTAWQDTWNGADPGDAISGIPLGPPAAIRITLTLRRAARGRPDAEEDGATYQHIVALPTSNSFTPKTGSE